MKYLLRSNSKNSGQYYVGMIAGLVVHVTHDEFSAKRFDSRGEAMAERSRHLPYLESFNVVKFNPDAPTPPIEEVEADVDEVLKRLKGKKK